MYVTPCTCMNACMSRYIHVLLVEYNFYLYYYLLCFATLTGCAFTCYLQLPKNMFCQVLNTIATGLQLAVVNTIKDFPIKSYPGYFLNIHWCCPWHDSTNILLNVCRDTWHSPFTLHACEEVSFSPTRNLIT